MITNAGERTGSEVVQLYARDLVGSLTRPVSELKDFQRITLQLGEARRVSFILREEDLTFTRAGPRLSAFPHYTNPHHGRSNG